MRGRGAKRRLFFAALHKRGKRLSCFLAKIPSCFFLSRPVSLQKKQTREDTAMTQYVYKKKFLPAGVSIFISIVFVDNAIVSFDR